MNNFRMLIVLFVTFFSLNVYSVLGIIKIDDPFKEAQSKSYFAINGTKVFHIPNELETTVEKRVSRQRKWDKN